MADNKHRVTPEEVTARVEAWQQKRRRMSATKVTRDDIERKLEAKAEARQRSLEEKRTRRGFGLVSIGLSATLLAAACGVTLVTLNSSATNNAQSEANQAQIISLKSELADMPVNAEDSPEEYEAMIVGQIEEASTKAWEVAELQHGFSKILLEGDTTSSGNGAPSPAALASVEHRRLLAPYFTKDALIADDADAYSPRSATPFEADEIDPRFPWYVGQSNWSVASVMPSSTNGIVDVTWVNQDASGDQLYAWAQARYQVSDGAFAKLSVGVTALGSADAAKGGQ